MDGLEFKCRISSSLSLQVLFISIIINFELKYTCFLGRIRSDHSTYSKSKIIRYIQLLVVHYFNSMIPTIIQTCRISKCLQIVYDITTVRSK